MTPFLSTLITLSALLCLGQEALAGTVVTPTSPKTLDPSLYQVENEGPGGSATGAAGDTGLAVDELEKYRSEIINSLAPLTQALGGITDSGNTPEVGGILPNQVASGTTPALNALKTVSSLLQNPAVQAYLKLFSNPTFSEGIKKIWENPNRKLFFSLEFVAFFFFMFFKAYRLSKVPPAAKHAFLRRTWVRTYSSALSLVTTAAVIPLAMFGRPYFDLISSLAALAWKYVWIS